MKLLEPSSISMEEKRKDIRGDPDEALVIRFQRGETAVFEQLFRAYERRVFNVIMRIIGSVEEAEDLKQETFFRAYRSLGGFRLGSKFSTWLFRIATNLCLDEIKKKRPVTVSVEELGEERSWHRLENASGADPLQEIERREIQAEVLAALEEVPPHYRVLLVLRYVEELPYEEIARVVGCSVNALNVRLHRARQVLKERMCRRLGPERYLEDGLREGSV